MQPDQPDLVSPPGFYGRAIIEAPTVHHFVVMTNDPAPGVAPAVFGIFRRVDAHAMQQVGVVQVLDVAIDLKRLGDDLCAVFDRELKGRVS